MSCVASQSLIVCWSIRYYGAVRPTSISDPQKQMLLNRLYSMVCLKALFECAGAGIFVAMFVSKCEQVPLWYYMRIYVKLSEQTSSVFKHYELFEQTRFQLTKSVMVGSARGSHLYTLHFGIDAVLYDGNINLSFIDMIPSFNCEGACHGWDWPKSSANPPCLLSDRSAGDCTSHLHLATDHVCLLPPLTILFLHPNAHAADQTGVEVDGVQLTISISIQQTQHLLAANGWTLKHEHRMFLCIGGQQFR